MLLDRYSANALRRYVDEPAARFDMLDQEHYFADVILSSLINTVCILLLDYVNTT